jgi:hypothetical protein
MPGMRTFNGLLENPVCPERSIAKSKEAKSKDDFDSPLICSISTLRQNPLLRSTRAAIVIFQHSDNAPNGH